MEEPLALLKRLRTPALDSGKKITDGMPVQIRELTEMEKRLIEEGELKRYRSMNGPIFSRR